MADFRLQQVMDTLADLYSRSNYLIQRGRSLASEVSLGDSVQIPSISALTIGSGVDSNGDPQNVSSATVTKSTSTLTVDKQPMVNIEIPLFDKLQSLKGNFLREVTSSAYAQLWNSIDETWCNTLAATTAGDLSATYVVNAAGDALGVDDPITAQAKILNQDGVDMSSLEWWIHPFAEGSLKRISGYTPEYSPLTPGALGVPRVGFLNGIPVYVSRSVPMGRTVAATASAIATNVWTITVPSGHGVEADMKITTSGGSADITTATAVTSVTATSITVTFTAGDDASNGALSVIVESAENLLVDTAHCYQAMQLMPEARIVTRENRPHDNLQIYAAWGMSARAGRVYKMLSPNASIS